MEAWGGDGGVGVPGTPPLDGGGGVVHGGGLGGTQRQEPPAVQTQQSPASDILSSMGSATSAGALSPTAERRAAKSTRRRHVSLLWLEKVFVLVLFFQRYALLWAFALPWPWPYSWQKWSRWTLAANLDFVSWGQFSELGQNGGGPTAHDTLWGTRADYVLYAAAWAVVPLVLFALPFAVYWVAAASLRCRAARVSTATWDFVQLAAMLLHTPAAVALIRVYVCETITNGSRLSVDPSVACGSGTHVAMMLAFLPSTALVVVGFPVLLARHVRSVTVYKSTHKHERYLRWKEAEYVHRLGYDWRRSHFWLTASFRRVGAYWYPVWYASQSALVLLYAFARGSDAPQADVFFSVCLAFALVQTVRPVYRCWSSNHLMFVASWCAAINAWFGAMRAHKMQSVVVVDSNFFLSMIIVNTTCGLWAMFTFAFTVWFGDAWPTGMVVDRLSSNQVLAVLGPNDAIPQAPQEVKLGVKRGQYRDDMEPPPPTTVPRIPRISELSVDTLPDRLHTDLLAHLEGMWIGSLSTARRLLYEYQMKPPEVVNVAHLMNLASSMRAQWKLARRVRHVLAWSLIETMDDLSALADACRRASCFPNPALEALLPALVGRLRQRDAQYALVPRVRRRLLLKLLAVRAWYFAVEGRDRVRIERGAVGEEKADDREAAPPLRPYDPQEWIGGGAGAKGRFRPSVRERKHATPAVLVTPIAL